jgi:hypothetical protein
LPPEAVQRETVSGDDSATSLVSSSSACFPGDSATAKLRYLPDATVAVLSAGSGSKRDASPLAYRDLRAAQRRIDRAYEASAAFLKEHA